MRRWKRYSFRIREGTVSAALDRQPNYSDFIRRALEHEIAREHEAATDSTGEHPVLARLAALERANAALAADMKELLAELRALAKRMPTTGHDGEAAGLQAFPANSCPSREELQTALRVILWSVQTAAPWSDLKRRGDKPGPV